jgi:hypothetical protein
MLWTQFPKRYLRFYIEHLSSSLLANCDRANTFTLKPS